MHDKTCGRTAGVRIPIGEGSLDELRRLDVGSWKGERWSGERIPTLDEVLAALPAGKLFFIELKSGAEIVPQVREVLARSAVCMECLRLLTFDAELAAVLKTMIPDVRVCLNVEYPRNLPDRVLKPSPDEILRMLDRCGAAGLSSQADGSVDAPFAEALRKNGKELHIWTVDSPDVARSYMDLGVDSLMTNRPGYLKAGLSLV